MKLNSILVPDHDLLLFGRFVVTLKVKDLNIKRQLTWP